MKKLGLLCSVVLSLLIFSFYTANIRKPVDIGDVHEPAIKADRGALPGPIPSLDEGTKAQLLTQFSHLPLQFIENRGQVDETVAYYVKTKGVSVFFTSKGVTFHLSRAVGADDNGFESLVIRLNFVNAKPVRPKGEVRLPGQVNAFIGSDPTKWQQGIPIYQRLIYSDLYPGIDLIYTGVGGELKYEFVIHPGADLSQIQLEYEGVEWLRVAADGALCIQTAWGEAKDDAPYCYQVIAGERVEVEGRFKPIGARTFTFAVADYNPNYALVLDPTLSYATYLGGSGSDSASGIAVDDAGNIYVTGGTSSIDFPTQNAYDNSFNGDDRQSDAFVTKLSASGDSLIYSTYLGGSNFDGGRDIAVDGEGNAYVTGLTWSDNFPTRNAADNSFNGKPYDVFVIKLSALGTLVYSTYLGGSDEDFGEGIAVDDLGSAYVTGLTKSKDFPTPSAYDNSFNGSSDAFVTKLSTSGDSFIYSTYLGTLGEDSGKGIAVDRKGSAYVTGYVGGRDFPTQNAYDDSFNGVIDAFVVKLSTSGNALIYSTYLGGDQLEFGEGIALDDLGNVYVVGFTRSGNFPTQTPYDDSFNGGKLGGDAFVAKLSASGDSLLYSTYLGGSDEDWGFGIAVDDWGNAYMTGLTKSKDFPTQNPYDSSFNGGPSNAGNNGPFDAFVAKLSTSGNFLIYSTYLGGFGRDDGECIAVDVFGNVYVAGETYSKDFPTQNAYDDSYNSDDAFFKNRSGDAFVIRFTSDPVNVSAQPSVLFADGKSTAKITIILTNEAGEPVTNEIITLVTTLGEVTSPATPRGNGVYVATYTAGAKRETAVVTAKTPAGAIGKASITLLPPQPSATRSTITATSPVLADGVAASQITVIVRDDQGLPAGGRKVKLSVTGRGNTVSEPALTDVEGKTTATLKSTQAETKKMTATVDGIELAASVEVVFFWEPPKAIVVLGGEGKNHPDWLTFNRLAEDVYQTLKKGGFKSEDIFFLSPAKEGEVDAITSKQQLQSAITQWAVEQHVGEHTPLLIYLLSHHTDEQFLLEPQGNPDPHLKPEEVATWVTALEAKVGQIQMTLFIEGCYSGRFLPHLSDSAKNRVIIVSTQADQQAFMTKTTSFSKRFFEGLQHGHSIQKAFEEAQKMIQLFLNQVPQLDANGDGKPNLPQDFQKIQQFTLGDFKASDLPQILKVTPEPKAPKQGQAIRFLAEVSGAAIQDVSGTLIPPGYDRSRAFKAWAELDEGLIHFDFLPKPPRIFSADVAELQEEGTYTLLVTLKSASGSALPFQLTFTAEQPKGVSPEEMALTHWGKVKKTSLFQNYPNPFNPETWIPYALANPAFVMLSIHSLSGERIREISVGNRPAGLYLTQDQAIFWDGWNQAGEPVASGLYFYTLTAGDFTQTRRLILAK